MEKTSKHLGKLCPICHARVDPNSDICPEHGDPNDEEPDFESEETLESKKKD